jgi:hypothetical protein
MRSLRRRRILRRARKAQQRRKQSMNAMAKLVLAVAKVLESGLYLGGLHPELTPLIAAAEAEATQYGPVIEAVGDAAKAVVEEAEGASKSQ